MRAPGVTTGHPCRRDVFPFPSIAAGLQHTTEGQTDHQTRQPVCGLGEASPLTGLMQNLCKAKNPPGVSPCHAEPGDTAEHP